MKLKIQPFSQNRQKVVLNYYLQVQSTGFQAGKRVKTNYSSFVCPLLLKVGEGPMAATQEAKYML
jgi:hypothetical protein